MDDIFKEADFKAPRAGESAQTYGQRVHKELENRINALGDPNVQAEVSYLNGTVIPNYATGSARPDVVIGPLDRPWAVVDLKTGLAGISKSWIAKLRSHLPPGYRDISVIELRPDL